MLAVDVDDLLGAHLARQAVRKHRHRHRQALQEIADDRVEDRVRRQAGLHAHLGQVLVLQPQRVLARAVQLRVTAGLEVGNHLLAAAAVAGQRERRHRVVARQHAGIDQWAHRQHEGAGVAPRHGDALAGTDLLALAAHQFRQAIGPVVGGAERRAGVDHAGVRVGHQFHVGTAGKIVKQPETGRAFLTIDEHFENHGGLAL
ncbi:hypothetical protein D9M69_454400 [compost metagenome]